VDTFRFGRFELQPSQRQLLVDGNAAALGSRAFDVLLVLVEHRDRVVTSKQLFESIWPGLVVEENNLRQQIAALRRVLGEGAIATVPGRGYRFVIPLDSADGQEVQRRKRDRAVVAVLPFTNLSGDSSQDYFSDAITHDIISGLSRHRWLTVLGRNATFGYRGLAPDLERLQRDLGASYVVQGSVRRAASRIRVSAELVDLENMNACWTDRYDRDLEQVFEVQDEITDMLVARLEPEIGQIERQRVVRARRTDLHAWDCYHLGVAHFYRFTATDNVEAQRLLQRSRELDPLFGEAHAWWAYARVLGMIYWDVEPDQRALDEALAAAQQALLLDERNALFYALKARVQLARQEYASAQSGNEIAIGLNPTLAAAHCGLADTLAYEGRYDEAMSSFRKAIALSPRDPQLWAFFTYGALALILKGEYEQAVQWTLRAQEIPNCQYWAQAHQAVALACMDRATEARAAVARLLALQPDFSVAFANRKLFYVKSAAQRELYLGGLARAGLPAGAELPAGR
jgi:TolB-like protein/Tfp pilus assembly protein PilF